MGAPGDEFGVAAQSDDKGASSLALADLFDTTRNTMGNEGDTDLPKLAAPARRALADAGYVRLEQLARVKEADLAQLHGMGPTAMDALRKALKERGLSFHG
jgi:hypothetical protein